jgi:hypothetical protein
MKLTATLLATVLLSASAFAFGQSSTGMTVTIPFAFQAAGHALPAGHYIVMKTASSAVLDLREIKGAHGAFLNAMPGTSSGAQDNSNLVFKCTQGQYSLAQVNYGNAGVQYRLPQSRTRYAAEAPAQVATLTLAADPR